MITNIKVQCSPTEKNKKKRDVKIENVLIEKIIRVYAIMYAPVNLKSQTDEMTTKTRLIVIAPFTLGKLFFSSRAHVHTISCWDQKETRKQHNRSITFANYFILGQMLLIQCTFPYVNQMRIFVGLVNSIWNEC